MAESVLISRQGAYQFLVAARDPALGPLVIGGQPAEAPRLQLCEAYGRHPPPLLRS